LASIQQSSPEKVEPHVLLRQLIKHYELKLNRAQKILHKHSQRIKMLKKELRLKKDKLKQIQSLDRVKKASTSGIPFRKSDFKMKNNIHIQPTNKAMLPQKPKIHR
ncbi:MAG: hypothetical protein AAFU64_07210, partial [Bacteroidota bacterium]